jgi:hypothetical protein
MMAVPRPGLRPVGRMYTRRTPAVLAIDIMFNSHLRRGRNWIFLNRVI